MVQRLWYGEMNGGLVELEKESIKFSSANINGSVIMKKRVLEEARKYRFGNLRASLCKIDGKNAHVKFCFYKIHVSLDLGINTEPTPPIKMGGHAPRGKIADPPISRVQNRDFTFLLLEPQDEEVLKM